MMKNSRVRGLVPVASLAALLLAGCAVGDDLDAEDLPEKALAEEAGNDEDGELDVVASAGPIPAPNVPGTPTISHTYLRCTGDGPEFRFSWAPTAGDPATRYEVDRRRGGRPWTVAYRGPATSVDLIAFPPDTLGVRVRGCNADGCSGYRFDAVNQMASCPGPGAGG
jgi:hypothetical protein